MSEPGKVALSRSLRALRYIWPVPVGALLVALVCWGIAASQTKEYEATSVLLFHEGAISDELVGFSEKLYVDPEREAATNDLLVTLPTVAVRASARLGGTVSPHEISEIVNVQLDPESNLVRISATDPGAARAAAISNAYGAAYVALRKDADQRKLQQAIRQLQTEYARLSAEPRTAVQTQTLRRGLGQLEGLKATQSANAQVVQAANVPHSPATPDPIREAGLGAIIGAVVGLAAGLALWRRGFVLRNNDDLGRAAGVPVISLSGGDTFRALQMCAPWPSWSDQMRTILVTALPGSSAEAGTVAARLAIDASRTGLDTVLVDCDLHMPTLGSLLGLSESPGLVDVLRDRVSMSQALQVIPSEADSAELRVLTAGSPVTEDRYLLEATGTGALKTHLAPLGAQLLVLRAPPISRTDLFPLLVSSDGTALAYRLSSGRAPELEGAVAQLQDIGVPPLAAIATADLAGALDDLLPRETVEAL